jgi:hypothetical protein
MKTQLLPLTISLATLLLLPVHRAGAASASGLEMENAKVVRVSIEPLGREARQAGLSDAGIRSMVEARLRAGGLEPEYSRTTDGYLDVRVNMVDTAFHILVRFNREVSYAATYRTFFTLATVWNKTGIGVARNPKYIMEQLEHFLNIFTEEYLAANTVSPTGAEETPVAPPSPAEPPAEAVPPAGPAAPIPPEPAPVTP